MNFIFHGVSTKNLEFELGNGPTVSLERMFFRINVNPFFEQFCSKFEI